MKISVFYLKIFSFGREIFFIFELGYTLFFLFLIENIECGYSLELPRQAVLTSTHNLCFEQKYEKYQVFIWKFSVFGGEIFFIFE